MASKLNPGFQYPSYTQNLTSVNTGTVLSNLLQRSYIFPHWISLERFHAMRSCPGTYYIIVVEDTELAKIVGCGTLFVEQKFMHEIAIVCILLFLYPTVA